MSRIVIAGLLIAVLSFLTGIAPAQAQQGTSASSLVSKSTQAVGYQVGGGSTKIDLKGTSLVPQAAGEAKVEAQKGITNIEVQVNGLTRPSKLGTEVLTYVL